MDERFEPLRDVLLATDFSDTAAAALAWAASLAGAHGARLHLVHVFQSLPGGADIPGEEYREVRAAALERLEELAAQKRAAGLDVATRLEEGRSWWRIEATARESEAGLVVVGTQGLRGARHLLLGSTAERVVQLAPCPVLCIHAGNQPRPVRKILIPTDFSEDAALAARTALSLFRPGDGARAELLHVFSVPSEYSHYGARGLTTASLLYRERVAGRVQDLLEETAESLRRPGLEVETLTSEGRHPGEEIVEMAARRNADLIALGTHGRSGLPHVLLGSTAQRVVQLAACPVLTVHRS